MASLSVLFIHDSSVVVGLLLGILLEKNGSTPVPPCKESYQNYKNGKKLAKVKRALYYYLIFASLHKSKTHCKLALLSLSLHSTRGTHTHNNKLTCLLSSKLSIPTTKSK